MHSFLNSTSRGRSNSVKMQRGGWLARRVYAGVSISSRGRNSHALHNQLRWKAATTHITFLSPGGVLLVGSTRNQCRPAKRYGSSKFCNAACGLADARARVCMLVAGFSPTNPMWCQACTLPVHECRRGWRHTCAARQSSPARYGSKRTRTQRSSGG